LLSIVLCPLFSLVSFIFAGIHYLH
jgi:hypothetical protein